MGFRYLVDGECIVCKRHTHYFCDHCGRFVCEDHFVTVRMPEKKSMEEYILCPDCAKKNKKPRLRVKNISPIDPLQ